MMSPQYKIPVSVLVVIHSADLQVLLLERADRAGFWQSVTGSKDFLDEPWAETARREVDEETFFRTRESGGTLISSAYKLCQKLIETEYPASDWNIYPFHFSDGDNWSGEDTRLCMEILENELLPQSNVFCYGQVESRYGSGQFYKDLKEHFGTEHDSVILSKIENKEGILASIKDFLGKGK